MSNDCGSVDTEEYTMDEEVNCVFCGKLFATIERVQEHISQSHESADSSSENVEPKTESLKENKPLRIYDLNTELIINKIIDYNSVVQCSQCDLQFINAYASRMHFEKVHLGRKRKRSSNPNGVEGIIVNPNGTDTWTCDICGRQFPTLKQAKVHKFKSHIEPIQKKKLTLHRNILRKANVSQRNYVKKYMAENKFREILPNSKKSKIDKYQTEQNSQRCINDGETESIHGDQVNEGSQATSGGATDLWRAAQAGSRGNKIVISRVYQSHAHFSGLAKARYGLLRRSGYSCFYCPEIFLNKENFKRHLLLHRDTKCNYKCGDCGLTFKRVRMLKQHQRQSCRPHFVEETVTSEPNGKVMISKTESIVPREVPQMVKLEKTSSKVTPAQVKDVEIPPRDIKFAEKFLSNPSITLNKGSQCVCNLCQSCFYSNNSIVRHLVLYHRIAAQDGSTALAPARSRPVHSASGPEPVNKAAKLALHFIHNCDLCGSQFASTKGLQRHMHSVHSAVPGADWTCTECSVSFNDLATLEAHRHECPPGSQSRRVKCEVCGRRFRNPVTLEEHRRLQCCAMQVDEMDGSDGGHNGVAGQSRPPEEKPKHRDSAPAGGRRTMHGYGAVPTYKKAKVPPNAEGLFECDVCHKSFTCRSSLSNHVKSHFNFKNKPFSCSSCHQGFMSTLTLQHHRDQLCLGGQGNGDDNSVNGSTIDTNTYRHSPLEPPAIDISPFLNFDGISQVPGAHYNLVTSTPLPAGTVPISDSGSALFSGNGSSLTTTRATSCMHCSAMFPDRSLLEDHASKEHSNQAGEVVCIICPRSFTTYMAFRVHMTKSHGGPNGTSLKSHLNMTNTNSANTMVSKVSNTSMDLIQDLSTSLIHADRSPQPQGAPQPQPATTITYSNNNNNNNNGTSTPCIVTKFYHQSRHACPNCDKDFSTSQALGNHKRACMPHLYKKVSL